MNASMDAVHVSLHRKSDCPDDDTKLAPSNKDQSLLQLALRLCRRHGIVNDRVTLLSPSDFLQVVQLCLAQIQKQTGKHDSHADLFNNGSVIAVAQAVCVHKVQTTMRDINVQLQKTSDSTTPAKDVHVNSAQRTPLKIHLFGLDNVENEQESEALSAQILPLYNDFLTSSNHIDAVDVLRVFLLELLKSDSEICTELTSVKTEVTGSPLDPLQALIVTQLTQLNLKKNKDATDADAPKSHGSLEADVSQIKSFNLSKEVQPDENGSADSVCTSLDLSKELLQELFRSYLNLLVNTRSELAFAHIFNTPERELTHQAFTHLKHQAKKKKMSLYQTAMSVIVQLRLGGRGYAPDPNSKLLDHVKGLGLLTDLMSKLQQLLEDTDDVRSSVFRVVNVIKKNLAACRSQRYKREALDSVAGDIQKDLEQVLTELQLNNTLISPDKPACQGGSLTSRRPRRVLLHYLDRCAVSQWGASNSAHHVWLNDVPFGPHTPSRFPCVLSQFRSPAVRSAPFDAGNKEQNKKVEQKKRKLTVSTNLMPEGSDQSLLDRCAKHLRDTVIVLPSKTIVHPAESRASLLSHATHINTKENVDASNSSPARKKGKRSSNPLASPAAAPCVLVSPAVGRKTRAACLSTTHSQTGLPLSKAKVQA